MASSANLEVTRSTFGVVVHNTKINFSKLYLRQIFSGSGTNQSDVIESNVGTGLGQTAVNNWGIYDGVGSGANLVAYGQGMHTYAGNWQNWFAMVFEVQRFKGSTLQIMGSSLQKSNEWAIVGGTGDFAMAHGVIYLTEYNFTGNEKIHELTIDGYCHVKLPSVPTPTMMGPWGGLRSLFRGIEGKSRRLESVTIRHINVIERLSFSYVDEDGLTRTAGPWGNHLPVPSYPNQTTIKFGPSEFVKAISGVTSKETFYMSDLKIVTNIATYGPFGTLPGNIPFNSTIPDDRTVVGFFVNANDSLVSQIGVYTT